MISGRNAEMPVAEPVPATSRLRKHTKGWFRLASWLFARKGVIEAVATRAHFEASPETVWNRIIFYEEVPGRPPFLLRTLLSHPVRTEGDKTRAGATVRCVYRRGYLVKRITTVESPHFLQFEVIQQCLGIEGCILTLGGSYQIYICGGATEVVLITNYQAYLRPRCLWRSLEGLLLRQLHTHILRGVFAAGLRRIPADHLPVAESLTPQCPAPGGLACTVSPSSSRR